MLDIEVCEMPGEFVNGVKGKPGYEREYFRVIRGPATLDNIDTPIHQMPIVAEGFPQTIAVWVESMGLTWRDCPGMLFAGYYVDPEGNCYYPSTV